MRECTFYLASYSLEIKFKAKICKRIGINNLFDESDKNVNAIKGFGKIRKFLKTHDLFTTLIFSGLKISLMKQRRKILI
jgi:hypothetical protein